MANPYHDAEGKFCSRDEMRSALNRLQQSGNVPAYLKLKKEFEDIEASRITEEEILKRTNPLATQTPVEVDNQLAEVYRDIYLKEDEIARVDNYIKDYEKSLDPSYRYYRGDEYSLKRTREGLERQQAKKEQLEKDIEELQKKAQPFEDEYVRRGRWTRAFLVTNGNGHVHKSMHCSTCNRDGKRTRFAWLPDYSGQNEEKIVDDAGESACTTCYPSAPVDVLKRASRIELPERKAAREAREAKARAKAEKEAITGIKNVDGKPLRAKTYYGDIKTVRTAEIVATDVWVSVHEFKKGKWPNDSRAREYQEDLDVLVDALAAKHGRSREEQLALITTKGQKKFKSQWGEPA